MCVYVWRHCMCMCMSVCVCACVYVYVYVCMCMCMCMCKCTCTGVSTSHTCSPHHLSLAPTHHLPPTPPPHTHPHTPSSGDCFMEGYEPPPRCAVIRQTGEPGVGGLGVPLLRSPLHMTMMWSDEGVPAGQRLSVWRPEAPPGCVVGCGVVCCVVCMCVFWVVCMGVCVFPCMLCVLCIGVYMHYTCTIHVASSCVITIT